MSEMETPTFGTEEKVYTGRVKWFNNRAGYGFITVNTESEEPEDLFVHHTAINVGSEQYKYLVEGEYINFKKIASENCDHKFQAGDVRGVHGGQLMCETRNSSRNVRTEKSKEGLTQRPKSASDMRRPRADQRRVFTGENTDTRVRVRGGGPREEWYLVKRRRGAMDERSRGVPQNRVVMTETNDEES